MCLKPLWLRQGKENYFMIHCGTAQGHAVLVAIFCSSSIFCWEQASVQCRRQVEPLPLQSLEYDGKVKMWERAILTFGSKCNFWKLKTISMITLDLILLPNLTESYTELTEMFYKACDWWQNIIFNFVNGTWLGAIMDAGNRIQRNFNVLEKCSSKSECGLARTNSSLTGRSRWCSWWHSILFMNAAPAQWWPLVNIYRTPTAYFAQYLGKLLEKLPLDKLWPMPGWG